MIERYPLKSIEKKWRNIWDLDAPLSFLTPQTINYMSEARPLVYKDIAQRRGKISLEGVAPLLLETYQDKDGNWVSFYDVTDENLLKKNKPVPMSQKKKNDILLSEVTASYGIDATRLFLVSDNPYAVPLLYVDDAIEGAWRFVNLFWQKSCEIVNIPSAPSTINPSLLLEIEGFFNGQETHKAIAKCREVFKSLQTREDLALLCNLLFPVMPHITSEIKERLFAR